MRVNAEMGKAADPADISVLFFAASANLPVVLSAQVVLSVQVVLSAPMVLSVPVVLSAPLVLAELENVIIYVVLS